MELNPSLHFSAHENRRFLLCSYKLGSANTREAKLPLRLKTRITEGRSWMGLNPLPIQVGKLRP